MKVFNGKTAAEEYMSSHTLTFSTPDMTLTRFAFWLGDIIPDPKNPGQTMLRMMAYVEEKDFAPVPIIDDEFVPTGAIRSSGGIYGSLKTESGSSTKFCSECGIKISQMLNSVQNAVLLKTSSNKILFFIIFAKIIFLLLKFISTFSAEFSIWSY